MKKIALALSCVVATVATPAFAGVAITGSVAGSTASYAAPAGSTTVINFNGDVAAEALLKGYKATTTGQARTFTSTVYKVDGTQNDYFRPEPTDSTAYFGVGRNSSLTLLGSTALSDVSVFIGSLDSYNVVSLLDAAGNTIRSFTGEEISTTRLPFPSDTTPANNRRITFSATDNTAIYGVAFSNNNNLGSFEFDNVAFTAAIPEPATWAMMLVGFGMVGAASRYRRRATGVRYA